MSGKTIVVIDDEPFIVEMITMFFELNDYTVHGANTGKEGLELVKVKRPDVLLLDLMLPDIAGFEVAAQLRAKPEFAHLPIVIISARTEPESRRRAMKVGATVYLTKPLKMPEVLAEVERVLAAPPAPPPAPPGQPSPSVKPEQTAPPELPQPAPPAPQSSPPPGPSSSPDTTPPTSAENQTKI